MFLFEFGVFEVGLDPAVGDVNVSGFEFAGAEVVVFVWDVGGPHEHVAGVGFDLLVANREQRAARSDDEEFVVRMDMPTWAFTDLLGGVEENGDAGSERFAFEGSRPKIGARSPLRSRNKLR